MVDKETRRSFLATSGKLLIATATFGSATALAAEGHHHHGAGDGLAVDAATKDTCATCQYWGGMRKVSKDKKQVIAQSMGWCNNPDSGNHQTLTAPDHRMMKPGIWKKWAVL